MYKQVFLTLMLFAVFAMPFVAGADGPPTEEDAISIQATDYAKIVQEGGYDIVVLSEDMGIDIRQHVIDLLVQEYNEKVLHWTVKEADGLQYVYAYPNAAAEDKAVVVDNKTIATRELLDHEIESFSTKNAAASSYVCNRLYRYYFWVGSQFMICGNVGGGSHGYTNLSSYGFNNAASSYYEDGQSCAVRIYDGYNYASYIGDIVSDWAIFNSTYNNKASSVIGYY